MKTIIKFSTIIILYILFFYSSIFSQIDLIKERATIFDDLNYFGYDFFKVDSLKRGISEEPISSNYLLKSGDEIVIDTWGDLNFHYILPVSKEGFITVPNVGRIYLNGNTFLETKKKIIKFFGSIYSSSINVDNPGTGTSIIDISLGKVTGVNIYISGEVKNPGIITVKGSQASIINVLNLAGGINNKGSLRKIIIRRENSKNLSFDFYEFLLQGRLKNEFMYLKNGDIVYVPLKGKEVFIAGSVKRPAIYELKDNENLNNLIDMAGRFMYNAYLEKVQIIRTEKSTGDKIMDIPVKNNDFSISLKDGDKVYIFSNPSIKKKKIVSIEGAGIRRPGVYGLKQGMRIKDLINDANGLFPDAFMERADLIRTRNDFQTELFKFSLSDLLKGVDSVNVFLKPLDKVMIYSEYNIKGGEKLVSIEGHVKRPGQYVLHENLSLYDLLFRVGGFDDPIFRKNTYLERSDIIRFDEKSQKKLIIPFSLKDLLKQKSNKNIKLQDGDIIRVYSYDQMEQKKYVYIRGEIKIPGTYELKENMTLNDLIVNAGGFNDNAYIEKIEVNKLPSKARERAEGRLYLSLLDEGRDYVLSDRDVVFVRKRPELNVLESVKIYGEVLFPGEYVIEKKNERLSGLIKRAGGLLDGAFIEGMEFYRFQKGAGMKKVSVNGKKALAEQNSYNDMILMAGDSIYIPTKNYTVSVEGEILFPKVIQYIEGKKVGFYINMAGGFTEKADKHNIKIIKPNGTVQGGNRRFWFDPEVPIGSKIIVLPKIKVEKEKERLDEILKILKEKK